MSYIVRLILLKNKGLCNLFCALIDLENGNETLQNIRVDKKKVILSLNCDTTFWPQHNKKKNQNTNFAIQHKKYYYISLRYNYVLSSNVISCTPSNSYYKKQNQKTLKKINAIINCETLNTPANIKKSAAIQHDKLYTQKAARHVELHPSNLNNGFLFGYSCFCILLTNIHNHFQYLIIYKSSSIY